MIPNRCSMCLSDGESSDHLFIHCPVANAFWEFFLGSLELIGFILNRWEVYFFAGWLRILEALMLGAKLFGGWSL